MIASNAYLSLLVLSPLPLMAFIIFRVSKTINKKSEKTQRVQSRLSTFVQEVFSGIRVLKAYNRNQYFSDQFEEENQNYKKASLSLAHTNSFFGPVMILLIGLSTVITVFFGTIEIQEGRFTFGKMIEFIFFVNMLSWPIAAVGWVSSLIQRAAASQERINEFLLDESIIKDGPEEALAFEKIEFKNVGLKYEDSNIQALQQINLSISRGDLIGITGKTGVGKSSIAYLIGRLYDPTEGYIEYNGNNLKTYKKGTLRSKLGYVPQDDFLFSMSIRDNISFGSKVQVSEEEIIKVAKMACIHENILGFKDGYDTIVGERGVTLSGGQKQRIAIARALLGSPEILILDDCLSAVDVHTEAEILSSLKSLNKETTCIVISQRVSTLHEADVIYVLGDIGIAEKGDHSSLIKQGGIYSELFNLQDVSKTPDSPK